jgi:hypothetical protein
MACLSLRYGLLLAGGYAFRAHGADGVASQELLISQSVGDQDVDQGQHHRRVGAGHDADPLRARVGEGVVTLGRE